MEEYNLIDALLDSYGLLEAAHERLCASIDPGRLDRAKFDGLQAAIDKYRRAVEAYREATMPQHAARSRSPQLRSVGEAKIGENVHYLSR